MQRRNEVDEGGPVLAGQVHLAQLVQHHGMARVEGVDGFQHGQRGVVLALLDLQLGLGQGQRQLGLGVLLLRLLQVLIPAHVIAAGLGSLGGAQVVEQRGVAVAGALEHQLLGLAVVPLGHGQGGGHGLLVGLATPARAIPAQRLAAQAEYPAQHPLDNEQETVEQHRQDHRAGDRGLHRVVAQRDQHIALVAGGLRAEDEAGHHHGHQYNKTNHGALLSCWPECAAGARSAPLPAWPGS